jgi:hypothetical protein
MNRRQKYYEMPIVKGNLATMPAVIKSPYGSVVANYRTGWGTPLHLAVRLKNIKAIELCFDKE